MAKDQELPTSFDREAHIDRLGEAMLGILRGEAEANGTEAASMTAEGAVLGAFKFMSGFENGLREVARICDEYRDQALRLIEAREAAVAPKVLQ